MWQNEPIGAEWTSLWDAPGDRATIDAWYREKLLANGWHLFEPRVPSTVQTEYWDGKWLLTVEHEASFANEHPPHARFRLRLTWDYWHSFERRSGGSDPIDDDTITRLPGLTLCFPRGIMVP